MFLAWPQTWYEPGKPHHVIRQVTGAHPGAGTGQCHQGQQSCSCSIVCGRHGGGTWTPSSLLSARSCSHKAWVWSNKAIPRKKPCRAQHKEGLPPPQQVFKLVLLNQQLPAAQGAKQQISLLNGQLHTRTLKAFSVLLSCSYTWHGRGSHSCLAGPSSNHCQVSSCSLLRFTERLILL